jgi:outer membrane receptor for monomeric catechols
MLKNMNLSLSLAIGLTLLNTAYAENQGGVPLLVADQTATQNADSQTQDKPSELNTKTLGTVKVEADAIPENEIDDYYNPIYDGTNSFYERSNSETATKTDTPIMGNPVSIQFMPQAVMDDQKSIRIKDVIKNISGVRTQSSLGFGIGVYCPWFSHQPHVS